MIPVLLELIFKSVSSGTGGARIIGKQPHHRRSGSLYQDLDGIANIQVGSQRGVAGIDLHDHGRAAFSK